MQRRTVLPLLLARPAFCHAAPRVKSITLAVTNPTGQHGPPKTSRSASKISPAIAPDFKAGTLIVTTAEPGAMETTEIPSQADDLDGDNKYDEIAFQIDLKPHQTRTVTLSYGDAATIARLRKHVSDPRLCSLHQEVRRSGLGIGTDRVAHLFR